MASTLEVRREGVMVGLIASVSVAAFYAAIDTVAARGPLYTVNLLGKAVFRGARDPAILQLPIPRDSGAILLYSGLHLVISLVIGLIVTWLIVQAERRPAHAPLVGLVIIAGFVVTVVAVGYLTIPIQPLLPGWSIVVANLLAVLVAGAYLLRRHPGLWQSLLPAAR